MCIHARTGTCIFQKHFIGIYLPHFCIPYVRKTPKIYPFKKLTHGYSESKADATYLFKLFQFLIERDFKRDYRMNI